MRKVDSQAETICSPAVDGSMRNRMLIPVAVFLVGVACIVAAAATGEAEVQLFIIFPLISGTSWLFVLGVLLIVASFILGFVFASSGMQDEDSAPGRRS